MKRQLLLILPSLQQLDNYAFRLIKYSRFPPLSLLTIAGMTPEDKWDILVRDEHIESSEVEGHVDLVGIQTYISCAGRAYDLAAYWRARGAKVVLGGLHPTSLPHEAIQHADAICTGPAETVWPDVLDDFERG
ncbi:MAG: cobalamin-dependent protein, partial [Planctomycetota bacterium]